MSADRPNLRGPGRLGSLRYGRQECLRYDGADEPSKGPSVNTWARPNPLFLEEFHHGLRTIMHPQLFEDVSHVLAGGINADREAVGDILVGMPSA